MSLRPWRFSRRGCYFKILNFHYFFGFNPPGSRAFSIADLSLPQDPFIFKPTATSDFGRFTSTQTPLNETKAGRVMQFALRYEF